LCFLLGFIAGSSQAWLLLHHQHWAIGRFAGLSGSAQFSAGKTGASLLLDLAGIGPGFCSIYPGRPSAPAMSENSLVVGCRSVFTRNSYK